MIFALAPGEIFSHVHNDSSVTMLVEGDVALEVGGTTTRLEQGRPMSIDANVTHIVVNLGPSTAQVKCFHIVTAG